MKSPSDITFDIVGGELQPDTAVIAKAALRKAAEDEKVMHFSRYKMHLYDRSDRVTKLSRAEATNGGKTPLLTIISTALRLIRAEIAKKVRAEHGEANIHWVITVPAMAEDEQLAFMREAAVEAGMVPNVDSECITLVSEPEAACAYMATQPMMADVPIGSTVAVLDCGGGTHDFVALKILSRAPFKAQFISESEGGAGGAADINEAFYREISRLVSRGESDTALQAAPDAIADLWRIAELAKNQLNEAPDKAMMFDLSFLSDCECVSRADFDACVDAFNARLGYAALEKPRRGMRVWFAARFFRDLVLEVIRPIEELARSFLARTRVDHVVLVGGFAESRLLKERLQAAAGAVRLLVPPNPSTCVARGGVVLMGAEIERVCRFTYGISCNTSWSDRFEGVRGAEKVTGEDGAPRCCNAFSRNIKRGTKISPGWSSAEGIYTPTSSTQTAVAFIVFRSQEEDPIVAAGQQRIGKLTVDIDAETMLLPRGKRKFGVSWTWEKEIVMIVTRKRDGRQWRKRIDLE